MRTRFKRAKNTLRPYVQWGLIICELIAFGVTLVGFTPGNPFIDRDLALRVAVALASFGVVAVAIFAKWDDDRPLNLTQMGEVQQEAKNQASQLDAVHPLNETQKDQVKREAIVNALIFGD